MKRRLHGLALACACIAISGCKGVQSALNIAGVHADHIEFMWRIMLYVCGVMYALVLIGLCLALIGRRRDRAGNIETPGPSARFFTRTLYVWTVLVVVGLLGLNLTSYAVDRSLFAADVEGTTLEVTGEQWWWNIKYNSDDPSQTFTTANEIHLPVNEPAHIQLRSHDVIHSFWVPSLNGKKDLIPGRDNDIYLHPTRVGTYRGQCAEFCGAQHAKMAFSVVVESHDAFEAWRARQLAPAQEPTDKAAEQGKAFFMSSACPLCHTIRGTDAGGVTGPDLTHVGSRAELAAGSLPNQAGTLAAWIADPQGIKPGNHMPEVEMGSSELQGLVAYLQGLK